MLGMCQQVPAFRRVDARLAEVGLQALRKFLHACCARMQHIWHQLFAQGRPSCHLQKTKAYECRAFAGYIRDICHSSCLVRKMVREWRRKGRCVCVCECVKVLVR